MTLESSNGEARSLSLIVVAEPTRAVTIKETEEIGRRGIRAKAARHDRIWFDMMVAQQTSKQSTPPSSRCFCAIMSMTSPLSSTDSNISTFPIPASVDLAKSKLAEGQMLI